MFKKLKLASALVLALSGPAFAADAPGVTATEIKIGGVFPFSGPASPIGAVGKSVIAYIQSINDRGGINGRKINYITYDDAYSPPKAVEHVRKLVESDEVSFIFSQMGTPGNTATSKYLTGRKIPAIGIVTGSNKFTDITNFPLTTTSLVSFVTEGKIYAKYLNKALPGKKYAILYQNDDLGKDYINAFKEFMKDDFDKRVVAASYEVSDPTVDSQIVNFKSSGADALLIAGTPKFSAQALRKAIEIEWKPMMFLSYPSSSASATLKPVGLDKTIGVMVGTNIKDPLDPALAKDKDIIEYRAFFDKYMQGSDMSDLFYIYGYTQGKLLEQILTQSGNDLSRENIMKQAKGLKGVTLPALLPGIVINTSENLNQAYTQLRLQRWTGDRWEVFSELLDAN